MGNTTVIFVLLDHHSKAAYALSIFSIPIHQPPHLAATILIFILVDENLKSFYNFSLIFDNKNIRVVL
jgi:hypothetical protein